VVKLAMRSFIGNPSLGAAKDGVLAELSTDHELDRKKRLILRQKLNSLSRSNA
jgi:hypothetical protein